MFFKSFCSLIFVSTLLNHSAHAQLPSGVDRVATSAGEVKVEELASLKFPWSMAYLPDGQLLITEKHGALKLLDVDKKTSFDISGVPDVEHKNQGGLLGLAIHPDFKKII